MNVSNDMRVIPNFKKIYKLMCAVMTSKFEIKD